MPTLTVYLVDHAGLSSALQDATRARVADLLTQTLSRAPGLHVGTGGITAVDVRWVSACPQGRTAWDVVINFQAGGGGSSCRQTRARGGPVLRYRIQGHTDPGPAGTRSVVYVPDCGAGISVPGAHVGSVAFHELLHNKLQMGDGLHSRPHMHHDMSLHGVGPATPLNDDEVRLLAPHLGDAVPQACP
jgi:hypothetical protein